MKCVLDNINESNVAYDCIDKLNNWIIMSFYYCYQIGCIDNLWYIYNIFLWENHKISYYQSQSNPN